MKYIAEKIPSMHVETLQNASLVDSKLPSDTFNTAFGGTVDKKLATKVLAYYKQNNQPMAWWIGPSSASTLSHTYLEQAGFTQDEDSIGMSCDLTLTPNLTPTTPLTIRTCETLSDFIDFAEVLSSVFDPQDPQVNVFYKKMAKIPSNQRQDMILFVGYEKEIPVATSCLFLEEVAGIYDIATKPEKRNLGYGSALLSHAFLEAKKRGYLQSILQASKDGLNLYKRYGFKEICSFSTWSNKEYLHKKEMDLKN